MKIAIATQDFATVGDHAGPARNRLVHDLSEHRSGEALPDPRLAATTGLGKLRDRFSRH